MGRTSKHLAELWNNPTVNATHPESEYAIIMTRKDFQQVADMIKTMTAPIEYKTEFALNMCAIFAQKNSRFKKEKFLEACGL